MTIQSLPALPLYPSATARDSLTPSQLSSLHSSINNALSAVLGSIAADTGKKSVPSSLNFLRSYAQDHAFTVLQAVIWGNAPVKSTVEKAIHAKVLQLAQTLAEHKLLDDLKVLVDLAIVYARYVPSKVQKLFQTASSTGLVQDVRDSLIPSFIQVLKDERGLYNQRKAAECIYCFVLASNYSETASSPRSLLSPFQSPDFLTALANLYLPGLATTARSYGGANALLSALSNTTDAPTDTSEWTFTFVTTKVTILDTFHTILKRLLSDLASAASPGELAMYTESAFTALFAMTEAGPSSTNSDNSSIPPTPFLNYSLLQDYQKTHDLSTVLSRALKRAEERDARLDLLESAIGASQAGSGDKKRDPGALKILLRGSGLQRHPRGRAEPSSSHIASTSTIIPNEPGPPASSREQENDVEIASKASQILELLPDLPFNYVTNLLVSSKYGGNTERVIEALLEGSAPTADALERELRSSEPTVTPAVVEQTPFERRNVFDDEVIDYNTVRFGKKKVEEEVQAYVYTSVPYALQLTYLSLSSTSSSADKQRHDEMKADILRRVETMGLSDEDDSDDDEDNIDPFAPLGTPASKGKSKPIVVAFEDDELDLEDTAVGIPGAQGESDSDDNSEDDGDIAADADGASNMKKITNILGLAYISDPAAFARDAATRRSKARADLKARTGWVDEQIEGWAIFLEKDVCFSALVLGQRFFLAHDYIA
ncbi:hypothetical protein MD484_g190, partial [Candolleomyces efflorescens]